MSIDLPNLHAPVDAARAVWRGLVLVGHRRSIEAGTMFWAIPGRQFADGVTLKSTDRAFTVLNAPTEPWLVSQQPKLKEPQQ